MQGERIAHSTGVQVRLRYGLTYQEAEAVNVVGYIPGLDRTSQGERVLLTAVYTGRSPDEGVIYPGADENASGVAVLLETARWLHDLDWIPKRTVVFAAFGEGGGGYFVNHPALPTRPSDVWTTVSIRGLAAGARYMARAAIGAGLDRAFDQSARRFGVRTTQLDPEPLFFVSNYSRLTQSDVSFPSPYQGLMIVRPGDALSGTAYGDRRRYQQLQGRALFERGRDPGGVPGRARPLCPAPWLGRARRRRRLVARRMCALSPADGSSPGRP
jgi:hypothetical protein